MRPYIRSVDAMIEQLPPLPAGDPILAILATAHPHAVETATSGDINYYEGNKAGMESHARDEARWRDGAAKNGEHLRQISADQAARLQEIINFYHEHNILPPADLIEKTFMAEAMAELPAELHGMSDLNLYLIETAESYVQSYKDRLDEREAAYTRAKELRQTRDKLGRPAKIAVWAGGVLLSAGITFGVSQALTASSESNSAGATEALTYVGAALVLLPVEGMVVGGAANKASKISARHRAGNKLARQTQEN